jgi:hypothetical protein
VLRACLVDGARLYTRSFGPLITVAAAVLVPVDLAIAALPEDIAASLVLVVAPAASGFAEGALLAAMLAPTESAPTALRRAWARAASLVGAALLSTAATLAGFLLLVAPGIFVAARLAVVTQVVMLEGLGARESLRRSWQLVRGRTLPVLAIVIVAQAPFAAATVSSLWLGASPAFVVTALAHVIVFPFTVAVLVALYRRLVT